MSTRLMKTLLGGAALSMLFAGPALAQTARATDPTTRDILEVLVERGVLTQEDANSVLDEARQRAEQGSDDVVRVPYVPEATREAIRNEVRDDVIRTAREEGWAQPDALPDWLSRFSLSGDVRVRGEATAYQDGNGTVFDVNAINEGNFDTSDALPLIDMSEDRYRAVVRARLAVDAHVNDFVDAGVRVVTGNLADPVSTNDSLDGDFNKITIGLDRAFIRVRPFGDAEAWTGTNLLFGQFENPFFSTEIMFDRDVQFGGAAATLQHTMFGEDSHVFATAGVFPLEEYSFTEDDKYLIGAQAGIDAHFGEHARFRGAIAYYDFENVAGQYNTAGFRDNDFTAPRRVQYGNRTFNIRQDGAVPNTVRLGLASEFEILALTGRLDVDLNEDLLASLDFEVLQNQAFDEDFLMSRSDTESSGDMAWHVRGALGDREIGRFGAWRVAAAYRYQESESTLDLFADSDFGLGGTDQEGMVIQGSLGLGGNFWLDASWHAARSIDVPGLTSIDIDTFRIDLNAKF